MAPSPEVLEKFRSKVLRYYKAHGRDLPWRRTRDPYRILVSEIMLQQTQVDRVIDKYREFLRAFPSTRALATAPLREVLAAWQGLGYNRRAVMLKRAAEAILASHGGKVPAGVEALDALPGIGHATACAICAYAFNEPVVYIETNIRSVFLHEFFGDRKGVRDDELLPLVEAALDRRNPRDWYNALMDYGVRLKAQHDNPSRRSASHSRQSRFEGSDRQIRGAIVRELVRSGAQSRSAIVRKVDGEERRVERIIGVLIKEGMLTERRGQLCVPEM